jgi:hypothetical protein
MDIMDEGLIEFWRILNKNEVAYIMVGGFAVNMNGYILATKDSDLWLKTLHLTENFLEPRMLSLGMVIFLHLKRWSLSRDGRNFI